MYMYIHIHIYTDIFDIFVASKDSPQGVQKNRREYLQQRARTLCPSGTYYCTKKNIFWIWQWGSVLGSHWAYTWSCYKNWSGICFLLPKGGSRLISLEFLFRKESTGVSYVVGNVRLGPSGKCYIYMYLRIYVYICVYICIYMYIHKHL